jgi:hypothetical protein
MKIKIVTAVLFASLFVSNVLTAADSAARKQLHQRSMEAGVGVPQVALLQVKAGPGRETALKAVRQRFGQASGTVYLSGTSKTEAKRRSVVQRGKGWALEVAGDGSKVRYLNYAFLDSAANKHVAVAARPAQQELETKGRRFISEQLGDLVRLGAGEEIVPLYTEYNVAGGGPTAPGAKPDAEVVTAANVVFGRTVDGVHVIGRGSKIAVTFGTDGTVAGFDYDWPEYRHSGRTQKVVPMAEVNARARKLAPEDVERRDVKVERVECGYLDRGPGRDAQAPLQSACAIYTVSRSIVDEAAHAKHPESGHITVAKITVVPAGETVEPDAKWALAQKHLGKPYYGQAPPKDGPKRTQ